MFAEASSTNTLRAGAVCLRAFLKIQELFIRRMLNAGCAAKWPKWQRSRKADNIHSKGRGKSSKNNLE